MTYVDFRLMSQLFGDNLFGLEPPRTKQPISLLLDETDAGQLPSSLFGNVVLGVESILSVLQVVTSVTGTSTNSALSALSASLSAGFSTGGTAEPTAYYLPEQKEIVLTDAWGNEYTFSTAEVESVWGDLVEAVLETWDAAEIAAVNDSLGTGVNAVPEGSGAEIDLGDGAISVMSGRVSTLDLGDDIVNVRIIEGPDYGTLTVNPDMSLALVLTGTSQATPLSFTVKVDYSDGRSATLSKTLEVEAGSQEAGWGLGDHYMLETDASGALVVEHGSNHRKVYVSGSETALSLEDIARLEGLSVDEITTRFLKQNTDYGSTPDLAVDEEVGEMIWKGLTRYGDGPSSDWLLFERGYEYDDFTQIVPNGSVGESALHPLYIGAYGEGAAPLIGNTISLIKSGASNLVIDGLDLVEEVRILKGENILLNDLTVTERGLNIQNVKGFTLRDSEISHVVDDTPASEEYWALHADRQSGIFVRSSSGVLIENTLFDHNGWEDGYDPGMSTENGQPPSIYSHNVYIQGDTKDVTFRDNIVMRAASDGAQLRAGGFVEDNVFIDNNNALLVAKGKQGTGNYSLVNGNVITLGAHKETENSKGGLTQGITAQGMLSSFLDNIVAHMADPDTEGAKDEKRVSQYGIWHRFDQPAYDDTIIFNWVGDETHRSARNHVDRFVDGLDTEELLDTTIHNFARDILGIDTPTIDELASYLSDLLETGGAAAQAAADQIITYFRDGFEIGTGERSTPLTLRFVPNDLGEGMRWDNRLNWSSETLPGTVDGDSVDLGGNKVVYGGTSIIADFDFGDGGILEASHGRLTITGEITAGPGGGAFMVSNAGQVWINGYADDATLRVLAEGGRFVNTGLFDGTTDMTVSGDAQVLLASDAATFSLIGGSSLTIEGSRVDVGFDGDSTNAASLTLLSGSVVRLVADTDGLSTIGEFYSGAFGDDSADVTSVISIEGATLELDLSELASFRTYSGTLLQADEITGSFSDVVIHGLGSGRDISITTDYSTNVLTYSVSAEGLGTGEVIIDGRGEHDDILVGGAGTDKLRGGIGNDTIDGGAGADVMIGGEGSDTIYVDNIRDRVVERAAWSGEDTVISSIDFQIGGRHIEVLKLVGGAIEGVGNGLQNTIIGNEHDNVLDGRQNDDTLIGGAGNDTYRVHTTGDTIVEEANGGYDKVLAFTSYTLGENVEELYLQKVAKSAAKNAINGTGNALANTIVGNAYDNVISGKGGRDILEGKAGDDTFVFNSTLSSANLVRIIDFNTIGGDRDILKIDADLLGGMKTGELEAKRFTTGTSAADKNDRFIFDQESGRLWFDADGSRSGDQTLIAIFEQNATITAEDILIY